MIMVILDLMVDPFIADAKLSAAEAVRGPSSSSSTPAWGHMSYRLSPRELAYCGLFGAASLLLPLLFHLLHLGHVFMPIYLPLVTLPFFVRPPAAAVTALLVPILSGAMTGMPPFFPPVAPFMAIELATMATIISLAARRWPRAPERLVLVPTLLLGRILYVGLVYAFSLAIELPAGFMAGVSLLGGWPGIVLMIAVVPPVARIGRRTARLDPAREGIA